MRSPVLDDMTMRVIPRPSARRRAPAVEPTRRGAPPDTSHALTRIPDSRLSLAVGVVLVLAATVGYAVAEIAGQARTAAAIFVAPLMAIAVLAGLRRWAQPSAGAGFAAIAFAGFAFRLLAALPRLVGGVDSLVYHREGARMAEHFRLLEFTAPTGRSIPGTGAVRYFVGLVHLVTNSSFVTTYLVFTLLAFVGQVAFLLGIRRVLSNRQFLVATVLVMAWPSLAFWPSSIGKEALVLFGVGFAVLGVAQLHERRPAGFAPLLIGLTSVGLVRPHVAMIALAAILVGLFARRDQRSSRALAHVSLLVIVLVGSMWLTEASASLFGLDSLDGINDVSAALDFAESRTSQDQAVFVAPRVQSPLDYPWAAVTVLFRPFPWEATNLFGLVSGIEGLAFAALLVAAIPGLSRQWGELLGRGLWLNLISFSLVFVFFFSAIGNFGILSRQRVQVLPFVLVVIAAGLAWMTERAEPTRATARPTTPARRR